MHIWQLITLDAGTNGIGNMNHAFQVKYDAFATHFVVVDIADCVAKFQHDSGIQTFPPTILIICNFNATVKTSMREKLVPLHCPSYFDNCVSDLLSWIMQTHFNELYLK